MDYFSILDLSREPFSNSPDPEFFFQSRPHQSCLQRLELALRLKRGLNVVIGDVGTGKTTLCRQLIRKFSDDPEIETHLVLDPDFSSPADLLRGVAAMFEGTAAAPDADPWQLKEQIKQALFRKGVDEKKTVVLIIDEGQKIPGSCLEPLREFLNYETNEHKLLQIAIFAQPEFENTLAARKNFADRINLKHTLGPMNFRDTREMIRFRLRLSSEAGQREDLFTLPGLWAVYRATGGYPRKIVHLCHQCLLAVIIQNRRRAGWFLVRSCGSRSQGKKAILGLRPAWVGLMALLALVGLAALPPLQERWAPAKKDSHRAQAPSVQQAAPPAAGGKAPAPARKETAAGPAAPVPVPDRKAAVAPGPAPPPAPAASETGESEIAASGKPDGEQEAAPEAAALAPPEILGTVVLQDRETLWRLVEKVYGTFDPDHLASIRRANPQIRNPKRVEVGTAVRVPAIPAKVSSFPKSTWWIRLDEEDSLGEAIDVLRNRSGELPPIRIVPHWNPEKGLGFSVLLRQRFTDEASARYERERLKTSSGVEAQIVSHWAPDTVFYANPYKGG